MDVAGVSDVDGDGWAGCDDAGCDGCVFGLSSRSPKLCKMCKGLFSGRGLSTGPGSVLPGCSGRRGLSTGSARAPGLAHRRQRRLRMSPEEFLHLVSAGSGDALCARRRRRVGAPTPWPPADVQRGSAAPPNHRESIRQEGDHPRAAVPAALAPRGYDDAQRLVWRALLELKQLALQFDADVLHQLAVRLQPTSAACAPRCASGCRGVLGRRRA